MRTSIGTPVAMRQEEERRGGHTHSTLHEYVVSGGGGQRGMVGGRGRAQWILWIDNVDASMASLQIEHKLSGKQEATPPTSNTEIH